MTLMFVKSVEDSGAQIKDCADMSNTCPRTPWSAPSELRVIVHVKLLHMPNSIGSVVQRNITSLPRDGGPAHVAICCVPSHGLQSKIFLISLGHRVIKPLSYCCTISSPMKTVWSLHRQPVLTEYERMNDVSIRRNIGPDQPHGYYVVVDNMK